MASLWSRYHLGAGESSAPRKLPYYGWVLVVTLGLTTIISYGTTEYLFGVLVVPIAREFSWSRASLSGAYSLMLVFAGVLGVPIGRFVDRHGARLVMATGSALAGLSLMGLAAIHALWQFYLLWAGGLGLATALTFYPVTFTVVTNWFLQRRGSALALLTLLGGLASVIFIPLAGVLVSHLGWRTTLVVLALVQLSVALPLHALTLRRHPEDIGLVPDGAAQSPPERSDPIRVRNVPGLTLSATLTRTSFWTLTVSYALAALAGNILLVHTVPYLIGKGYGGELAASFAGAVGLTSLPGRYVLNTLSDRVGPQRLLCLCLGGEATGVLLLLRAGSSGVGWLVAYVIVYGASFGAVSPLRAGVMAEQFGRRAYGAITSVQGVPVALAAGLGPLLAGWLYDQLESYTLALGLCTAAFVLSALFVGLTSRPAPQTVAEPRIEEAVVIRGEHGAHEGFSRFHAH